MITLEDSLTLNCDQCGFDGAWVGFRLYVVLPDVHGKLLSRSSDLVLLKKRIPIRILQSQQRHAKLNKPTQRLTLMPVRNLGMLQSITDILCSTAHAM